MLNIAKIQLFVMAYFFLLVMPTAGMGDTHEQDSGIGSCEECGQSTETNVIYGTLDAISFKASMLQLSTESGVRIVTFDDNTILTGTSAFSDIAPESDLAIEFLSRDGAVLAVSIAVNAGDVRLESNQINAKTLAQILSDGTSQYTLIDARPDNSYDQGHIPGAISIYNGEFAENTNKLPSDKEQLIVYYCDGTA